MQLRSKMSYVIAGILGDENVDVSGSTDDYTTVNVVVAFETEKKYIQTWNNVELGNLV